MGPRLPALLVGLLVPALASEDFDQAPQVHLWTCDEHGEAIYGWSEAVRLGHVEIPATLVHFDSHADMSLPKVVTKDMSSKQLAQTTEINDFIPAAIALGYIDKVIWVRPEWAVESEHGSFEYVIAQDTDANQFVSDAPFTYEHALRSTDEMLTFEEPIRYQLEVVPFTEEALNELDLQGGRYLLDVDLDVFATENYGAMFLREADLDIEQIEAVIDCACNGEKENDWEVCLKELDIDLGEQLEEQALAELEAHGCVTPVHYSTDEEVRDAVEVLKDWTNNMKKDNNLPGGITVARSTKGYLPPAYLEPLQEVETLLASFIDAEALDIACVNCVEFTMKNDLASNVTVLYHPAQAPAAEYQMKVEAGETASMSTYVGHAFFCIEEKEPRRYYRHEVEHGKEGEHFMQVSLSELQPLGEADLVPSGEDWTLQRNTEL